MLFRLTAESNLRDRIEAMVRGEKINFTENPLPGRKECAAELEDRACATNSMYLLDIDQRRDSLA